MEVSIIIPVYNAEKYLARCIDSILNQTFQDFELILIDDKSTDSSKAICKQYIEDDSRILFVENEKNMGVSATRNKGIDLARGKFIMFCDNDDIVSPYWIEHLITNLYRFGDVLPICSISTSETTLGKEKKTLLHNDLYDKSHYYLFNKAGIAGYIWNTIYYRDIVVNHELRFRTKREVGDINEDLIFSLQYIRYIKNLIYIGFADYYHAKNETNHSSTTDSKFYFDKYLEKYNLWREYLYDCSSNMYVRDLSTESLYHFLHSLSLFLSTDNRTVEKMKFFQRVVYSEEISSVLEKADLSKEDSRIVWLLKKKHSKLLWLFFIILSNKNRQ